MGAYIYMLRSPKLIRKIRVKLKDGSEATVEAGVMSFLFKPLRFGCDSPFEPLPKWERGCVILMARMEQIWDRFGNRPKYTVMPFIPDGEKQGMHVGDQVLFWTNDAPIWSWDTPCFEGSESYGNVLEIL